MKILIVDDEVNLVRNLASYLTSFQNDFEVLTAWLGEDAIDLLKRQAPDILLTDIRLPGIDGLEVVRRALELHPQLKVIVMTAFGTPELRNLALKEGALRFIEKPIDLEGLRVLLQEVHDSSPGWSGLFGGLDIFDLAQLLAMSQRSKAVRVVSGPNTGILISERGQILHASTHDKRGEEAFYEMVFWVGGKFEELGEGETKEYLSNINIPTMHLMMEAARLRDESRCFEGTDDGGTDVAAGPGSALAMEPEALQAEDVSRREVPFGSVPAPATAEIDEWLLHELHSRDSGEILIQQDLPAPCGDQSPPPGDAHPESPAVAWMRGSLSATSLVTLIRLNCEQKDPVRLDVISGSMHAKIYFNDGDIVHAELGTHIGEEVIYELMTWEDSDFEVFVGETSSHRTIDRWFKQT